MWTETPVIPRQFLDMTQPERYSGLVASGGAGTSSCGTEEGYSGMSTTTARGFSISIFLPDGTADGIRTVEKSNWIGRGIVCPRSQFPSAKDRREFDRPGVYVLTSPPAEGGLPTVYIGEGDPARPRLEQHFAKKDFWTTLVTFTSKDDNLNKAHVQYLESRLICIAKDAKRCTLDNGNMPQLPALSEPDVAEMESFLAEMLLIFPVLGLGVFEKPAGRPSEKHILHLKAKGLASRGYETAQGFVVLQGSCAATTTVPSCHKYMVDLREALTHQGILVQQDGCYVLTQDYTFESPSTAAGVMLGRTANGRIEWKDGQGQTLKDLQSAQLAQEGQ